jgi:site-specific DNA-methyltransferase (adenine-specific)
MIFATAKLGNHTYNPQLENKEASKIRPIGKRKAQDKSTYGEHNGQLSKGYDNTKSYPKDIISTSSKQKECNSTNRVHPTQKPVALMEYLIKTYTNEGELVLDFTMGSGTTGVACKNLGRDFIGIEMDDKYFDIAKKRIEDTAVEKGLFD